ncbi:MAG: YeeE/YedE family protein [Clostridium sp.]|nr:YeeE/YedE family protein [Clostridium sp.]MBK5241983.1 YeeE/YedE family protein [Clostridium sp.]
MKNTGGDTGLNTKGKAVNTKAVTNKTQYFVGFAIIIAMVIFTTSLSSNNPKLGLYLITGLAIGYIMQRSSFGFAGGIKKIYVTGDSSLTKALMFMLTISIIITAAIHYGAFAGGAEVASRAFAGATIIPGTQFIKPINALSIIGGILFGTGMMFGGGCASGTLTDAGEGEGRALITLFFFITGALWGEYFMGFLKDTVFFTWGPKVYLPDSFGYVGAIMISLLGCLAVYAFAKWYENRRKKASTLILSEYSEWQKALPETGEYKFFSKETYHKFFIKRWSLYTGAVLLTVMFEVIILTTGSSWGVTSAFVNWGAWIYGSLGIIDVSKWASFSSQMDTINGGFMNDPDSMRNLGIIIGAVISPLLAGHFSFKKKFKLKDAAFYAMGGLLMGFGARFALGCNIGAFYSAIANFSLSGWVFMLALVLGGVIGVNLIKKFNITI